MKLTPYQQKLYDAFYESTCEDGVLDPKTEALVGLASAIAMDCEPCTAFYIMRCQGAGVSMEEKQSVLAKVMAVAAGQKRLQTEKAIRDSGM